MSVITGLLDVYGTKKNLLAEVLAKIDTIAGDLAKQRDNLTKEVKTLDDEIKDKAKYIPQSQAHTLVGTSFQLVWNERDGGLDVDKVTALIEKYNKVSGEHVTAADLKKEVTTYWSIRKTGSK